jgi:toxin ParE1/3/4
MRPELRYRAVAISDLEEIFRSVLRITASPVVARRYVERIRALPPIPTLPLAERPRYDLAPGLRSVAFERRAVILYRVIGETVEITNVFHGGRDYAALYRRGDIDADD